MNLTITPSHYSVYANRHQCFTATTHSPICHQTLTSFQLSKFSCITDVFIVLLLFLSYRIYLILILRASLGAGASGGEQGACPLE